MEQSSLVTVAMKVLCNNHYWLLWQWECYVTIITGYYTVAVWELCNNDDLLQWHYACTDDDTLLHLLARCMYTNNNSTTIPFRMRTLLWHWERFSVVFHQKLDHMISIPLSINIHIKLPHFYMHVYICLGNSQNLSLPVHTSLFMWVGQDEDNCIFSPSHLGF